MINSLRSEADFEALADFDVDIDTLFDVLSHSYRRFVLACLQEYDTPMALSDIADELAISEFNSEITEREADTAKEIYLTLYHTHIPKMVDAGLIEYSDDRDAVAPTANSDEIASLVNVPSLS